MISSPPHLHLFIYYVNHRNFLWVIYWGALCRENWQGSKKKQDRESKSHVGSCITEVWPSSGHVRARGRGEGEGAGNTSGGWRRRYSSETFWAWAIRISAMSMALCILHELVVGCRGGGLIRVGTSWERQACLLSKTVLQRWWVVVSP